MEQLIPIHVTILKKHQKVCKKSNMSIGGGNRFGNNVHEDSFINIPHKIDVLSNSFELFKDFVKTFFKLQNHSSASPPRRELFFWDLSKSLHI